MTSMCKVVSCVVGRGSLLWPVCSLEKTVSLCPASFCTPRPNLPVTQVSLDFLLLHSNPLWWKGHLLWVFVLEGLVGVHRTIQLQPLFNYWLGHRLGLLWYWMAWLEMNRVHLVIFELAPKNCISDSFVNLENIVVWETKGLANWIPKLYTYPLNHRQFWTWGDQIPLVVALALGEQSKI